MGDRVLPAEEVAALGLEDTPQGVARAVSKVSYIGDVPNVVKQQIRVQAAQDEAAGKPFDTINVGEVPIPKEMPKGPAALGRQERAGGVSKTPEEEAQEATYDAYGVAPITAAYARQSREYYDALTPEAGAFATIEHYLSGDYSKPFMQWLTGKEGGVGVQVQDPAWWQDLKAGLSAQVAIWYQTQKAMAEKGQWKPEDEATLESWLLASEKQSSRSDIVQESVGTSVKAAPGMAVLMGASAGGRAGLAAGLLYQNYGPTYDRLIRTGNYSNEQAQALALASSGINAAFGAITLNPMLRAMVPEALQKKIVSAAPEWLLKTFVESESLWAKVLGTSAPSKALHGLLSGMVFSAQQAGVAAATDEVGERLATGKPVNGSHIWQATVQGGYNGLLLMPLVAAVPLAEGLGRLNDVGARFNATVDQGSLGGIVENLKNSEMVKEAPDNARQLFSIMSQRTNRRTLFVDRDVFERAARGGGYDPDFLARLVSGRGLPQAGAVPVPTERFLVDLVRYGVADKMVQGARFTPQEVPPKAEAPQPPPPAEGAAPVEPAAPAEPTARAAAREQVAISKIGELDAMQSLHEREYGKATTKVVNQQQRALQAAEKSIGKGQESALSGISAAEAEREGMPTVSEYRQAKAEGKYVESVKREVTAGTAAAEAEAAKSMRVWHGAMKDEVAKAQERAGVVDRYLDQQAQESLRLETYKGSSAHGSVYDGIMEALGKRNSDGRTPMGFDDALNELRASGLAGSFDIDRIRGLVAYPHPLEDMTVADAENLRRAVQEVRRDAAKAKEARLGEETKETSAWVKEASDALLLKEGGLTGKEGALRGLAKEQLRAELLWEPFGRVGRSIMDGFVAARNLREEISKEAGIHSFFENLPRAVKRKAHEAVDGPESEVPEFKDRVWTRGDLWELGAWMGSETGAQGAIDGLLGHRGTGEERAGMEARIWHALDQLSKDEWDHAVDARHRLNDKLWERVAEHEAKKAGLPPPKVEYREIQTQHGTYRGGYVPRRWTYIDRPTAPEGFKYFGDLTENFGPNFPTGELTPSFVQERAPEYSAVPVFDWSTIGSHYQALTHYLAFDEYARGTNRLLNDRGFRALARDKLGDAHLQQLNDWAAVVGRGHVEAAVGARETSKLLAGWRADVATAVFRANLPVTLMQLSHIPAAMFELGLSPIDVLTGMGSTLIPSTWATAHAESTELPYRWADYARRMREMVAEVGGDPHLDRVQWLSKASWSAYHFMDGFLSKTIYESARLKYEGQGMAHADAVREADRSVRLMMPARNIMEQSAFARDRGMLSALMLVRNFPNTVFNASAWRIWQAKTQMWESDFQNSLNDQLGMGEQVDRAKGDQRRVIAAQTAGALMGMYASVHVLGRALGGYGRQEKESLGQYLFRETLAAPFYQIPLVSDLAEGLAPLASGSRIRADVQNAPVLALMQHGVHDLYKLAQGEGEEKAEAALDLLGRTLGVPPLALTRSAVAVWRDSTGRLHHERPGGLGHAATWVYGDRPTVSPFLGGD